VYRVFVDTTLPPYWRDDGLGLANIRSKSYPNQDPWCRRVSFQYIANDKATGNKVKYDLFRQEYFPFGKFLYFLY